MIDLFLNSFLILYTDMMAPLFCFFVFSMSSHPCFKSESSRASQLIDILRCCWERI